MCFGKICSRSLIWPQHKHFPHMSKHFLRAATSNTATLIIQTTARELIWIPIMKTETLRIILSTCFRHPVCTTWLWCSNFKPSKILLEQRLRSYQFLLTTKTLCLFKLQIPGQRLAFAKILLPFYEYIDSICKGFDQIVLSQFDLGEQFSCGLLDDRFGSIVFHSAHKI